jgi:hypothetical protein
MKMLCALHLNLSEPPEAKIESLSDLKAQLVRVR